MRNNTMYIQFNPAVRIVAGTRHVGCEGEKRDPKWMFFRRALYL